MYISDKDIIEAHNGAISELIKNLGRNLMRGQSLLYVSLPVTIIERETTLSQMCKSFSYGTKLL